MGKVVWWEGLSKRFPIDTVESIQGFDYIAIEAVINRFNNVLGNSWSTKVSDYNIEAVTLATGDKWFAKASVITTLELETGLSSRAGIGAAVNPIKFDPDMVVKTALANAFKKSANYFGVGQYLWDEEERAAVEILRGWRMRKYTLATEYLAKKGITPDKSEEAYEDALKQFSPFAEYFSDKAFYHLP